MEWEEAYKKYNHNIFRHLAYIHRYIHYTLNDRLVEAGYQRFRMSFIDVILYLDPEGIRLTDLVELHQSPKASLARLINSIHHQGFIDKRPDPSDSRANILYITDKGVELVERASRMTIDLENELSELMGDEAFVEFSLAVQTCFEACGLSYPPVKWYLHKNKKSAEFGNLDISPIGPSQKSTSLRPGQLQMQINAIVKYIDQHLFENNQAQGYGDLQNSHRAVLSHIASDGTRASVIAKREGLTKQSISDISHVLIQKKYLKRIKDPDDKRAHRLAFAERGEAMMISAMETLLSVEGDLCENLGAETYRGIKEQAERLWFLLEGESPSEESVNDFSDLDTFIKPLLKDLLSEFKRNHTDLLSRAFHKTKGQHHVSEALMKYIQAQKI